MGTGGPLEAPFELVGPIPAGTWRLVADGIIIEPVDVLFEVIWRPTGGADVQLFSLTHHFDPQPTGFDAVPFEMTAQAPAAAAAPGDLLIFRYSATNNATVEMAYIPNGDGELHNGRIPFLELP